MINSDPTKAKRNQKLLKIGLLSAGFVLFLPKTGQAKML